MQCGVSVWLLFSSCVVSVRSHNPNQAYFVDANHRVMKTLFGHAEKDTLATIPLCYYEKVKDTEAALKSTIVSNLTWKEYLARQKGAALKVQISLQLLQVTDVSEKDQTVSLVVEMVLSWMDCRLRWSSRDSDVEYITLLPKKFKDLDVFVPIVRLLEATDPQADLGSETLVSIFQVGEISLSREFSPTISCNINVRMYPFDVQNCSITFESAIDEGLTDVGYQAMETEQESHFLLANDRYLPSDTWGITLFPPTPVRRRVCGDQTFNDSYCFHRGLRFTLLLRRQPFYQLINLIFPSFLVVVIASCVFLMPPSSTDKMGLSVTILLSMFMFTQLMYDKMPDTGSVVPILSQFFMVCIGLVGASCIFSAFSAVLEYSCRNVPTCIKGLVRCLAPLLMFDMIQPNGNRRRHKASTQATATETEMLDPTAALRRKRNLSDIDEANPSEFEQFSVVENSSKIEWRTVSALADRCFFLAHFLTCVVSLSFFLIYGFSSWREFGSDYNEQELGYICAQLKMQGDASAHNFCGTKNDN